MTRAAVAKLLILVILAFIICLPEFFTLKRASKVSFLCLPYRPCERGIQVKRGVNGKIGKTKIRHEERCDPSPEKWEQACGKESQSTTADPGRSGEDLEKSWFMCETDMDMLELQSNISSSGLKVYFEVSVELQLRHEQTLNLTLFGHSNLSSLHLLPPEEQEEEGNDRQLKAFYCCLPVLPKPRSTTQSRCLLWLSSQTVLNLTAKEGVPWERTVKGEWGCVLRVLWLALLCVVLLAVVTTVIGQIYSKTNSGRSVQGQPVRYSFTGQQLRGAEKHAESITPTGMTPHLHGSWSRPGLSPIQEVDHQVDRETLLEGNIDSCYTVNLHHRGHPSTSEEQPW
ncbi:uncharacterized protein LOC141785786 [Halichoeres trimaculatus]|uniref:uncharacterized protein LOC141785786 n=1 Tax=Halichoeres trimaculatus TaxID=147232 RepID=UPI003D9DE347